MNSRKILSGLVLTVLAAVFLSSCAIVRPGEVAVKRKLGRLADKVYSPGAVGYNPFVAQVVRVPTRTINLEVKLNLPSKEGLNVGSEISILYHIKPEMAKNVIESVGEDYEEILLLSVFRSAAADICAQYMAKDMHSGNRGIIEEEIRKRMESLVADRGFVIEAVLLKSINLPSGLYSAIEDKLMAEQRAQRMQFVLDTERQEAERKKIEAAGIRDAQVILTNGLNEDVIRWRSLEVLNNLASSPNAKLIITNGSTPVLINEATDE